MKIFQCGELREALTHAREGGQSLHLHRIVFPSSPRCFRLAVERGEDIAHLFDLDRERLVQTAKRLGVRWIVVEREGTDRQHVDLCAGPLRQALREANSEG